MQLSLNPGLSNLAEIDAVATGIDLRPPVALSDGAQIIHSAIFADWPQAEHLICLYAHMCRAVKRHRQEIFMNR